MHSPYAALEYAKREKNCYGIKQQQQQQHCPWMHLPLESDANEQK